MGMLATFEVLHRVEGANEQQLTECSGERKARTGQVNRRHERERESGEGKGGERKRQGFSVTLRIRWYLNIDIDR